MQLYEQIEKEFDELSHAYFEPGDKDYWEGIEFGKSFLKQSFIKFLEGECERLEKSKKDTRISNGGYGSGGVAYAMCTACGGQEDCTCESYNQALSDTISHYQNMIKELQK